MNLLHVFEFAALPNEQNKGIDGDEKLGLENRDDYNVVIILLL